MSKIYNSITILLCATVLYSCDNTESIPEEVSRDAIAFSAITEQSPTTRAYAVGDFPNDGRIGVVAANYMAGSIDWTSYVDINNAAAKATAEAGGIYTFAWEQSKYWPFDDSQLAFIAYSPVAKTNGSVILNNDKTSLSLSLENNMPDVLYASANSSPVPYSKSMQTPVDLGEFKHALSQLTINVKGNSVSDVDLIALEVMTSKRNATLNLLDGDAGVVMGADDVFIYNLVTGSQDIITKAYEKTVLLYPGTEDVTMIKFILKEKSGVSPLTYSYNYLIPFFQNTANPSKPITLERAKNTTLKIVVNGISVSTPALLLDASLMDWIPMGEFGVNIK